jgi:hypothetical protein
MSTGSENSHNDWDVRPLDCHIKRKTKRFAISRMIVNLYGRSRIARANRSVSRSGAALAFRSVACVVTGASQTAHCCCPAPTIAPQFRQSVGRPDFSLFVFLSKRVFTLTSVMLFDRSITLWIVLELWKWTCQILHRSYEKPITERLKSWLLSFSFFGQSLQTPLQLNHCYGQIAFKSAASRYPPHATRCRATFNAAVL